VCIVSAVSRSDIKFDFIWRLGQRIDFDATLRTPRIAS